MQAKRPENMTVAETLDAIFGEGTTDQICTPEEAAIARQPFDADDVAAPVKIEAEAFRALFPVGTSTVHRRTSEIYGVVETPLIVESSNETRIVFRRTDPGKKGSIRHVFSPEIEHDLISYELIRDGVRVRCGSDSWVYTRTSR
jgi:hypothetical protein